MFVPRQPAPKAAVPRRIGRTKGGLNSKLHHAIYKDSSGPIIILLSEGQMNDRKGAGLMIDALQLARELLADRGYGSDGFRAALAARGITPGIPPRKNSKTVIEYNKTLYRQRYRIENTFGRLKDWRRIATRYDRYAHTCFSAICIAATVIFWLGE
jgi:putative transposase